MLLMCSGIFFLLFLVVFGWVANIQWSWMPRINWIFGILVIWLFSMWLITFFQLDSSSHNFICKNTFTFPYGDADYFLHHLFRTAAHALPLTQNSAKWKIDVAAARGRSLCLFVSNPTSPLSQSTRVLNRLSAAGVPPHQVRRFAKAAGS